MKEKFESVKQENKRLLEIINAKPLETVDIDSAFEIEKLKEQLQAKEQECERLKEEVSLLKESNSKLQQIEDVNSLEKCYLQQIDQLKAENEKLDTENKRLVAELANPVFDSFEELDNLKQTLTEVKEIAETISLPMGTGKSSNRVILAKQILQKISECEVENAR